MSNPFGLGKGPHGGDGLKSGAKALDISSFGLKVKDWQGRYPLGSVALTGLKDATNVDQLIDFCSSLANASKTGSIDERCMLPAFHSAKVSAASYGSLLSNDAKPKAGTNWNGVSSVLPGAFDGSDLEKSLNANLTSYGLMAPKLADDYYDRWTAINAETEKNFGKLLPGGNWNWGADGSVTIKLDDRSTYTAGPAT